MWIVGIRRNTFQDYHVKEISHYRNDKAGNLLKSLEIFRKKIETTTGF